MAFKSSNILILAFRNLSRHKVKSALTISAVTIGVALYIWVDCFLLGVNLDSRRNLVNYETGSAKIYSKAFFEKKEELPLYESFSNYEPIMRKLSAEGYNSAPHSVFTGSLLSKDRELPFLFIGIDPILEKNVFKYYKFLEGADSRFVENGKFETLLGVRGAKDLGVMVGDKIRCSVTIDMKDDRSKIRHVYQIIDLVVSGIVNSPNPKTNGNIAYLPLDILQDEKGLMLNGSITELCIRQKGTTEAVLPGISESPEQIRSILGSALPENLAVVGWQEDAKDYLAVAMADVVSNYIPIIILLILAIVGIANSMLMAILERTKEIGMLRSLGMKDSDIIRLFFYEAGMIGFIGSAAGIVIGVGLDIFMIYHGIDYTKLMEDANMHDLGYRVVGIFKGAWNPHTIIGAGVIGTLVAAFTAIMPALRAVKTSIVDALRFE
jgi:ABC-type lipoprotein release transport system permease subunit